MNAEVAKCSSSVIIRILLGFSDLDDVLGSCFFILSIPPNLYDLVRHNPDGGFGPFYRPMEEQKGRAKKTRLRF